jgi:hypothetical protein
MPIQATCPDCERVYTVKDELAGKRFRCKQCSGTVPVPAAEASEDDFSNLSEDDWEGGEPAGLPPMAKPKSGAKKAKTGKKKKKAGPNFGGSGMGTLAWVIGGVVGVIVLCGGVGMAVKSLGLGAPAAWEEYTTPDGQVTMQMPGTPKKPAGLQAGQVVPGGEAYAVEKWSYACAVIIEPIPELPPGMTDDEFYELVKQGIPQMLSGATDIGPTTIDGRAAIQYTATKGSITVEHRAIRFGPKTYTFTYGYRSSADAEIRTKFFDSIRVKAQ